MHTMQFLPILLIILIVFTSSNERSGDRQAETPQRIHSFVNGSVTIQLPPNWVASEDESRIGRIVVMSDAKLKDAHAPVNGAMGTFTIGLSTATRSPADRLAWKLYDEGDLPDGAEIEELTINGYRAARMSAQDILFAQEYLWYAVVIHFADEIVVFASFTGLGDYEKNGVIDAVMKLLAASREELHLITNADITLYSGSAYALGRLTVMPDGAGILFSLIPNADRWVEAALAGNIDPQEGNYGTDYLAIELYYLDVTSGAASLIGTDMAQFAFNAGDTRRNSLSCNDSQKHPMTFVRRCNLSRSISDV